MVNEQPLRPARSGMATWERVFALAAVLAAFGLGIAIGRAGAAAGTSTGTSTRTSTAYCTDLGTLRTDLAAVQASYAQPGPTNAYAAAEIRDGGAIYNDAGSSSNAPNARALALALTLDGQTRQEQNPDPALLARVSQDVVTTLKAAPGC